MNTKGHEVAKFYKNSPREGILIFIGEMQKKIPIGSEIKIEYEKESVKCLYNNGYVTFKAIKDCPKDGSEVWVYL